MENQIEHKPVESYMPPMLVEVGDFNEDTLGWGSWLPEPGNGALSFPRF